MITPGNILKSEGAAQYLADTYCLKLKTKSLANLRSKGGGPAYFKDRRTGVVYYSKVTDIDPDVHFTPNSGHKPA